MTSATPFRVIAITDSDSYVKWAAATLDTLDDRFESRIVVVQSPIQPSPKQVRAAVDGTRFAQHWELIARSVKMTALEKVFLEHTPDVLLLAATGPVLEVVTEISVRLPRPPALISGIPGMALPARTKGLEFRARGHAFVVHSHKEAKEYGALMAAKGIAQNVVVSTLPFLPARKVTSASTAKSAITSLVFTPQALVPPALVQRQRVLRALHATARNNKGLEVIVKLRALAGEQQTHSEALPYDLVWEEMCEYEPELVFESIRFKVGPFSEYLVEGSSHVTISSTAALESIAAGVPTMIVDDFGLNERLLNAVYAGSGCVGSLADLEELDFGVPDPQWMEANYFHTNQSQLPQELVRLATESRQGSLEINPPVNFKRRRRRLTRNFLRSSVPPELVKWRYKARRTVRRAIRHTRRAIKSVFAQ